MITTDDLIQKEVRKSPQYTRLATIMAKQLFNDKSLEENTDEVFRLLQEIKDEAKREAIEKIRKHISGQADFLFPNPINHKEMRQSWDKEFLLDYLDSLKEDGGK